MKVEHDFTSQNSKMKLESKSKTKIVFLSYACIRAFHSCDFFPGFFFIGRGDKILQRFVELGIFLRICPAVND